MCYVVVCEVEVTVEHDLSVEWSIAHVCVMLLFVKVEVTVEHDLSVEWSIALHMSCHQAVADVFDTVRRIATHRLGNLTAHLQK